MFQVFGVGPYLISQFHNRIESHFCYSKDNTYHISRLQLQSTKCNTHQLKINRIIFKIKQLFRLATLFLFISIFAWLSGAYQPHERVFNHRQSWLLLELTLES